MTLSRFRPFAMLSSGLTTVGLIAVSPDALPPTAVAGLLILSFGLMVSSMHRSNGGTDSVSA